MQSKAHKLTTAQNIYQRLLTQLNVKIVAASCPECFDLGAVDESPQCMSSSTSSRLRCLDFTFTRGETAHSHNRVGKGNVFKTVCADTWVDKDTCIQNLVTEKVSKSR